MNRPGDPDLWSKGRLRACSADELNEYAALVKQAVRAHLAHADLVDQAISDIRASAAAAAGHNEIALAGFLVGLLTLNFTLLGLVLALGLPTAAKLLEIHKSAATRARLEPWLAERERSRVSTERLKGALLAIEDEYRLREPPQ